MWILVTWIYFHGQSSIWQRRMVLLWQTAFCMKMKPVMIVVCSHTALVTSAVILESYFSSHFGKTIDTIWLMTFLGYSLNWGIQSLCGGNICLVLLVQLVQMIVTMSQNNNNNKCWKLFPWMICCCFFGMWVNWAFASVVLPVFCSDYSITWARTLRCLCMQLFFLMRSCISCQLAAALLIGEHS